MEKIECNQYQSLINHNNHHKVLPNFIIHFKTNLITYISGKKNEKSTNIENV